MKTAIMVLTAGPGRLVVGSVARTKIIALAAFAICVFGFVGTIHGAGQYWKGDYPASSDANGLQVAVTYTLWIPDGVSRLRAIIVHQHGAGTTASKEGSTAAYDLHWQALAKKWDCALFCSSYHVLNENNDINPGGSELWFDPRRGSEKAFLRSLDDFAAKSDHPEIQTVPWALWGHSSGGIWADMMSTLHPDRVIGMWLRSGSAAQFRTHPEFVQPEVPAACYAIPIMLNPGIKEKATFPHNSAGHEKGPWWGNLATFTEYRAKGALVGFAPDPRTGHECGDSRYLAIPYLDACLAMRLPDKGDKNQTLKPVETSKAWLASLMGDQAQPASEFKGNLNEAVWLPNEAIAKAWMEYVKTGAVSDTTAPPAPYDVKVTPKGNEGMEISWSADADFESGVRCFIVMRDGEKLAQVPENPVGQFGRPLFQSMTYHDTPKQPLAKMEYLDASAKTGEKHTYAVVSVNSVHLSSEPSAPATTGDHAEEAAATAVSAGVKPSDDMVVWYRQPGKAWMDGSPLGNGITAAMVFGGTHNERIASSLDLGIFLTTS